jgi:hypothetical protein
MLSQGKHRNPRKGACFMEMASFLAGERWSDHPTCTHPLLADVARLINDNTSDPGRQRLAGMIPSVIGLTSDDPHVDGRIALRCATMALPVVASQRQCVMAVSVLTCERALATLDGREPGALAEASRWALAQAPYAARWAELFTGDADVSPRAFRRRAARRIVRLAVEGIASSCIADPDSVLRELLAAVIEECAAVVAMGGVIAPGAVVATGGVIAPGAVVASAGGIDGRPGQPGAPDQPTTPASQNPPRYRE